VFVTQFKDMAELIQCVEALAHEADIKMMEKVGLPNIPFSQSGPPLVRCFARGLLSYQNAIISARIPTNPVALVAAVRCSTKVDP
jgi:hypothetical protein